MNILNSIHNSFYTKPSPPLPDFTPFQFTIETTSGIANYSGTANNYPITFNTSATSNTYGSISNFTSNSASNFTIYVKGKNLASGNSALMPLLLNFESTTNANTFMLLGGAGQNNHKKITFMIRLNNNLDPYLLTGDILANQNHFYHSFMNFDYGSALFSIYIYSYSNQQLYKSENNNYPTSIFSSLNKFAFSKISNTSCSNVTINNAGWYNRLLTSSEMSRIVSLSPN
jgi:hypothetical protein